MIDAAPSSRPRVRVRRRRPPFVSASLAGIAILAALATNPLHPLVLINTTPSEPPGLYAASAAPVRVGAIIAFKAPSAAFPYADRKLGYLHRISMLKAVAAGPGDSVCTAADHLVINGRDLAPIASRDGEGRALPRWTACRQLGPDELFVFSARVPNSFDSRYFGPVSRTAVMGVFNPLLTRQERA
jgi:conjugative transfer signal peptidase TraF